MVWLRSYSFVFCGVIFLGLQACSSPSGSGVKATFLDSTKPPSLPKDDEPAPNDQQDDDQDDDQDIALEKTMIGFGGMYSESDEGQSYTNPATGDYNCPDSYQAFQVFGSEGEDSRLYACQKLLEEDEMPFYDFAGVYGFHSFGGYENATTGDFSCPATYTSYKVFGSEDFDYSFYFCAKEADDPAKAFYGYGGFLGSARLQSFSSLPDEEENCINSYENYRALGSSYMDWPLDYCVKSLHEEYPLMNQSDHPDVEFYPTFDRGVAAFGGMYSIWADETHPNSIPNPATGDFTCPDSYEKKRVRGADRESGLWLCYKMDQGPAEVAALDFGGMYGEPSGSYTNPFTGSKNCPEGFEKTTVIHVHNHDWPLTFCHRPQQPDAPTPYSFGGIYTERDSGYYNNPITEDTSCPEGHGPNDSPEGYQVHGWDIDWKLFMCGAETGE